MKFYFGAGIEIKFEEKEIYVRSIEGFSKEEPSKGDGTTIVPADRIYVLEQQNGTFAPLSSRSKIASIVSRKRGERAIVYVLNDRSLDSKAASKIILSRELFIPSESPHADQVSDTLHTLACRDQSTFQVNMPSIALFFGKGLGVASTIRNKISDYEKFIDAKEP